MFVVIIINIIHTHLCRIFIAVTTLITLLLVKRWRASLMDSLCVFLSFPGLCCLYYKLDLRVWKIFYNFFIVCLFRRTKIARTLKAVVITYPPSLLFASSHVHDTMKMWTEYVVKLNWIMKKKKVIEHCGTQATEYVDKLAEDPDVEQTEKTAGLQRVRNVFSNHDPHLQHFLFFSCILFGSLGHP